MSGIAGFFVFKQAKSIPTKHAITSMLTTLESGTNSQVKYYVEANKFSVGICNSNNVCSAKMLEEERYVISFNGYLSNKEELADMVSNSYVKSELNECHLILKLFSKHGKEMITFLKGSYVLTVWDKKEKNLIIGTDRHGYGYVYYYVDNNYMVFASEIKAMLVVLGKNIEPNVNGICDIYNFHTVYGNDTPFKKILLLPHATLCEIREENVRFNKYWEYPFRPEHFDYSIDEIVALAKERLKFAVINAINSADSNDSNNHIGIMLSGGLDARLILGIVRRYLPERQVHLFHMRDWLLNKSESVKELSIAKECAEILDCHIELFDYFSEDSATDLFYELEKNTYLSDGHWSVFSRLPYIIKIAEKYPGIILLNGYLLDTLFKSGFAFFPKDDSESFKVETDDYVQRYSFVGDYLINMTFLPEFAQIVNRRKRERIEETNMGPWINQPTEASLKFYCLNRGRRYIYFNFGKVLGRYVNMSSPGTDYDLMDFAFKIPYCFRNNTNLYRRLISEWLPELGDIAWSKTGKPLKYENRRKSGAAKNILHISKYALQRTTHGRIDLLNSPNSFNRALRTNESFMEQIRSILYDKKAVERGFFDEKGLDALFKRQLSGRDHAEIFMSLISVEMLFRRFFDA